MKSIRPYLRIIGSLFGTILLIYQVYKGYIALSTLNINLYSLYYFGLGLLLIIVGLWLFYVAWKILLSGFGISIPYLAGFRGFMLSFVARYIPGTIWGYLNRNEWLAQQYRVPYEISTKALIYEIELTILASMVMIGLLSIVQTNDLIQRLFYLLLIVILIISTWTLMQRLLRLKIFKTIIKDALIKVHDTDFWKKWLTSLGILVMNWFFYGIMLFFCVQGISLDSQHAFTAKIITQYSGIFSLSWLMGFVIPFVPSGIGIREITLSALLTTFMGIENSQAAAISVTARLITTFAELFWIILLLGLRFGKNKKTNQHFV